MNIKAVLAAIALVFIIIIGINYYSTTKSEKSIAARMADKEAMELRLAKAEREEEEQEKIKQKKAELEVMPEKAQEIILAKEAQQAPETEFKDINFEKEDRAKLDEIVSRWNDESAIASRTSRIALPSVVKELQSIKREFDKVNVTPCLTRAQANMSVAMESEIAMYLKFMSDSKASITGEMLDIHKAQEQYYLIIKKCTD